MLENSPLRVANSDTAGQAQIIRVSASSRRCNPRAGAVNQAVKALALARRYLGSDGIDMVHIPHLMTVDIDGQERTVPWISVERRS